MPTVFITGAGRGIGLELARQYADANWQVIAGVRSAEGGEAVLNLPGDVAAVSLDVADPAEVSILAERMKGVAIDLLICNAGVYGPRSQALGDLDYPGWEDVLRVNTLGPLRIIEAFLDHLRAGSDRTIVAITSKMGSIADNGSGRQYYYRSSKAALNAAMRSVAIDLAADGFRIAVLHPGWVRTDMGGPNALISVEQSVDGMRAVIAGLTPETSGGFFNYDGRPIPW